jgi:hypothetical protein
MPDKSERSHSNWIDVTLINKSNQFAKLLMQKNEWTFVKKLALYKIVLTYIICKSGTQNRFQTQSLKV